MLSKYYAEVTPMMDMLLISADILDSFQNLWLSGKWANGMDKDPVDVSSCTT
jgi:hypothetical protein